MKNGVLESDYVLALYSEEFIKNAGFCGTGSTNELYFLINRLSENEDKSFYIPFIISGNIKNSLPVGVNRFLAISALNIMQFYSEIYHILRYRIYKGMDIPKPPKDMSNKIIYSDHYTGHPNTQHVGNILSMHSCNSMTPRSNASTHSCSTLLNHENIQKNNEFYMNDFAPTSTSPFCPTVKNTLPSMLSSCRATAGKSLKEDKICRYHPMTLVLKQPSFVVNRPLLWYSYL